MRSNRGAWSAVLLVVVLALAALLAPGLALADTAPPPTAQESNTLVLALVALGALSAVLVLARPRRGKG